jgi:hypothetical protein
MPGIVLRLALTLTLLRWSIDSEGSEPSQIDTPIVSAAISLVEHYFKPMAERVFGDAALPEAERNAAAIARMIRARKVGTEKAGQYVINVRTDVLRGRLGRIRSSEDAKAAIEVLCEANWLRPLPERSGDRPGRPRSDYLVNPAIWSEPSLSRDKTDNSDKSPQQEGEREPFVTNATIVADPEDEPRLFDEGAIE